MTSLARPNQAETVSVDDDLGQYRAVSGLAIAGLLAGMFSALALTHPLLGLVPVVALIVNILALRRIAQASPGLIGRKAALAGMALSLVFGISPPIEQVLYVRDIRAQSLQIAQEWFTALREDRPEAAHRLSHHGTTAAAREQSPLKPFQSGMIPVQALRKYVREAPVDLLLKLGRRAHVRLYKNQNVWADNRLAGVHDFYVVTVGKGADAVSFFILLGTTRSKDAGTGEWQWQVSQAEFVHIPPPELMDALSG